MKMKHILGILIAIVMSVSLAQAAKSEISVKAGDTAYVCGCGAKCGCEVAALKAAKCGCGHDLTKVTVTKVKGKKAFYQADGKEQSSMPDATAFSVTLLRQPAKYCMTRHDTSRS